MKYNLLIVIIISFLVGCGERAEDAAGTETGDEVVLVRVDGEPITLPMLERVMDARGIGEDQHEAMRDLLDELIRLRVVANAAIDEGIDREPEVRAERQLRDMESLYRHYLDRAQRAEPVTDEQIEAVYRSQRERAGDTQYRIETIIYPSQSDALREIARLEDGEIDYEAIRDAAEAAGRSVEQPGWIDRSQVPEEFATLLAESSAGEVVPLPLDTPQGWRLVRVTDTRELEVPALDEVREGIARRLLEQRRQARIEKLYEQAEVEPMLPLDEDG